MEGIFVITPSQLDETLAMNNLVKACNASGTLVQMIRFMGQQPEANARRIPPLFRSTIMATTTSLFPSTSLITVACRSLM
jgi:hypothetical protein